MEILMVTISTIIITFALTPLFQKIGTKRTSKLHIHHSVIGVALLVAGLVLNNSILASIGLGIYTAHGFEEIYYNKRRFPRAFLVFVTRN